MASWLRRTFAPIPKPTLKIYSIPPAMAPRIVDVEAAAFGTIICRTTSFSEDLEFELLRGVPSVSENLATIDSASEFLNRFTQDELPALYGFLVDVQSPRVGDAAVADIADVDAFPLDTYPLACDVISVPLEILSQFAEVHISDDLLDKSLSTTIDGKDYAAPSRETGQKTLFPVAGKPNRESSVPPGSRRAVAPSDELMSIWDELFIYLRPPLDPDKPGQFDVPHELYKFQLTGIKSLISNGSFLLGDEMGTGKTVMTVVALRMLYRTGRVSRTLIVCPKSILDVWRKHLREWAPEIYFTIVDGNADDRRVSWRSPFHVYVISYDKLRIDGFSDESASMSLIRQERAHSQFDVVVLDEAHHIRNPETKKHRAVRSVIQQAKYRWALTGTPIQNSIDDLRAIFDLLCPGLFPSATSQLTPLMARELMEPYFLRRTKSAVMADLPDKIRTDEWLELDDAQRQEYDTVFAHGRAEMESGKTTVTRMHIFALIQRLKRICNFAHGMSRSPKTDALLDQIEEIVASEKKVLIFSQYVDEGVEKIREVIEANGYSCAVLSGGTTQRRRDDTVRRFQTDPKLPILLATVKTAGEGLTLTAASYVIHFDQWWNPAAAWQAEDRAHRKGQTETVNVYSYWMRNTIEERIYELLNAKGLLITSVIDALASQNMDESISMEELLHLLGIDIGKVRLDPSEKKRKHRTSQQIAEWLQTVDPFKFEELVAEILRAEGYRNAYVTKASGDRGIDIEASRMTTNGSERVIGFCKRMPHIGPVIVRELLGVLASESDVRRAFLATSGQLSDESMRLCQDQGGRIVVWNCSALVGMIRKHAIDISRFRSEELQ